MFDRLFLAHPRSVGESYAEHFGVASRVGATMLITAGALFMHALVPAWFKRTGSLTILRLHRMLVDRNPDLAANAAREPQWPLEYEI